MSPASKQGGLRLLESRAGAGELSQTTWGVCWGWATEDKSEVLSPHGRPSQLLQNVKNSDNPLGVNKEQERLVPWHAEGGGQMVEPEGGATSQSSQCSWELCVCTERAAPSLGAGGDL